MADPGPGPAVGSSNHQRVQGDPRGPGGSALHWLRHQVNGDEMISLLGLDPAIYSPSVLHHPDRTFPETNCYVDLWIELLHAHGIAPESALAAACSVDFEGDQWTFFKPCPEDLRRLHGIDVHEMQLYRPAVKHVTEQLRAG